MKPKFMVLAAMLSASIAAATAQAPAQAHLDSLKQSHHVITFGEGPQVSQDSVQRVIDRFYYNQFKNSQEPEAPYFIFMSKDGSMAMGIGGSLQARGWYSWGGYTDNNDGFITSAIPMHPDKANSRDLTGNVNQSQLFFKMIGNHSKIGPYTVFLQAKFNGGPSGVDFKLSKAYAIIGDWTVGYANSTFEDPASQPFTVDEQGPNAEIGTTDVLVRWMHTFKQHNVVALSLEMPNEDEAATTQYYSDGNGYLPNIAGFYQYQWGNGQHVRLSGIMRFLNYRDLVTASNRTNVGWGVKLSTVFTPSNGPVDVFAAAYYGKGIASLTNDLSGLNYDLLGKTDKLGRMYAPGVFGAFAGVQYNFNASWFASASVSEVRFLPGEAATPDMYRYGLYGAFNVGWYVTPRVLVAAEFDLGCHKEMSMDKEWAHRAGILAQFSF